MVAGVARDVISQQQLPVEQFLAKKLTVQHGFFQGDGCCSSHGGDHGCGCAGTVKSRQGDLRPGSGFGGAGGVAGGEKEDSGCVGGRAGDEGGKCGVQGGV